MTTDALPDQTALAHAHVSWGGADNPLLTALPGEILFDLSDDPEMQAIARLFISEMQAARCGVASVLNRLGEVLIVRLMRAQIETGGMRVGLLAALSDPRLSRAVVAIHDRPGHPWRLDQLAAEAGLSVSRFSHIFRTRVGQTPLSYLRHWRLVLAKQDIERGDRIARVAARYAYGSPEALSRAFSGQFGRAPRSVREATATARPE
ncbi:MAG: AraC family transcriptional regulator [Pseudomonadota bacterium]